MEAAAELVVDPAVGHGVERPTGDRQRPRVAGGEVTTQQVLDRHRLRELGRLPPATVGRVERGLDGGRRRLEEARRGIGVAGVQPGLLDEPLDEPSAGRLDLDALLAPGTLDALEHLAERRHAVARLVREVGPAVERPAFRGQEDRHRPTPAAGHRLDGRHVDLVEVRPLLAIHLDRHEMLVEVVGRRHILERLPFHDVAPVAGRVADAQEDRPIEQPRPGKRVGPPGRPVDRVAGVLEEIRAGLSRESVRHRAMVRADARSTTPSRQRATMTPMSTVPGFLPSTHGLHFANRFPPSPPCGSAPSTRAWFAGWPTPRTGCAAAWPGTCASGSKPACRSRRIATRRPTDRRSSRRSSVASCCRSSGCVRRSASGGWVRRATTTRRGGPATANGRRSRPRSRRATWRWSAWSATRA